MSQPRRFGPAHRLDSLRRRLEYVRIPLWDELRNIHLGAETRVHRRATLDVGGGGTIRLGRECQVHAGAMLVTMGRDITFGDRCSVNPYTIIYGGVSIGNDVRIAAHVVIVPMNHVVESLEIPIALQGVTRRGIVVEDDVWLGARAVILDGVTLASGTVVAAGAVVTRSTKAGGIYAGSPARLLKLRGETGAG